MMQRPTQTTRPLAPIRVRAIEAALRAELNAAPTQITDAIPPVVSRALAPLRQPARLPRERGYPYLLVRNPYEETSLLIEAAVAKFAQVEGVYPTVIYLSAFRFLTYGQSWQYFYPSNGYRIPYQYGGTKFQDAQYDILLRGEQHS